MLLGYNLKAGDGTGQTPAAPPLCLRNGHGSVTHYPAEDSKLRATTLQVRRGGNCPNTLEVLQQLLRQRQEKEQGRKHVTVHLVSTLPSRTSAATAKILASFGRQPVANFAHCLYREGHDEPASSYIIRSQATGSRTIVNFNDLPEMTEAEFVAIADRFGKEAETWWHFEVCRPP